MEVTLGSRVLTAPTTENAKLAMLLWGPVGSGKTTLAATAPGNKLWIQFDPDALMSLHGKPVLDTIATLDLSGEKHFVVERFKDDDPFGIERALKDRPDIETIVYDSVTPFSVLATENAVHHTKSATLENPGLKGYGHRNALTLRSVVAIMRVAKRLNRHLIVTAHEDSPEKREDGTIEHITMALGGKMANQIGVSLNEVWWISSVDTPGADLGKRRIALRPVRKRQPMKTRMFDASAGEFTWEFNPDTWTGEGIAEWFNQWKKAGGKIPAPGTVKVRK